MRSKFFIALLLLRYVYPLPLFFNLKPPTTNKDSHLPMKSEPKLYTLHKLEEAETVLDPKTGMLPPDPPRSQLLTTAVKICQLEAQGQLQASQGTCKTIRDGVLHPDHRAHRRLVTFSNGGMVILKVIDEHPILDPAARWSGQKEAKAASMFDELLAHGKFKHVATDTTYWIFALKVKGQKLITVPGVGDHKPDEIKKLQTKAEALLANRHLKIDPWAFKQAANWVYHKDSLGNLVAVFWPQQWADAGGRTSTWVGHFLSLYQAVAAPKAEQLADNESVKWLVTTTDDPEEIKKE